MFLSRYYYNYSKMTSSVTINCHVTPNPLLYHINFNKNTFTLMTHNIYIYLLSFNFDTCAETFQFVERKTYNFLSLHLGWIFVLKTIVSINNIYFMTKLFVPYPVSPFFTESRDMLLPEVKNCFLRKIMSTTHLV